MIADDQELTLDYLKNGLVSACISSSGRKIQNGQAEYLGDMEYVLVAALEFIKKYFKEKCDKQNLQDAPAIRFDQSDRLLERYLEKFFDIEAKELKYHMIPSVKGLKMLTLSGYGYTLIPKIDIIQELKENRLVQLHVDKTWKTPLYWHYWDIKSKFYQKFNKDVIQWAKTRISAKRICKTTKD